MAATAAGTASASVAVRGVDATAMRTVVMQAATTVVLGAVHDDFRRTCGRDSMALK
jgi:hypothetical protein